ncbi:NPCBM/NEW2 domain-containing protein [Acetivibrio cellulolyticus]|uniref:NPCBM/NEW2 domain-containing protein n=1 Tax=Acetivibrio cellulolyticus TaxID=35830 RepID=UPI0001E3014F|nr:NPCBM/NEW2 domain-containing protein [Acetivibrio cellulolyticus]
MQLTDDYSLKVIFEVIFKVTRKNANVLADMYLLKDKSIISKWKNRKNTPKAEDIKKIVEFVISESTTSQKKIIRDSIENQLKDSSIKKEVKDIILNIEDFSEFLVEAISLAASDDQPLDKEINSEDQSADNKLDNEDYTGYSQNEYISIDNKDCNLRAHNTILESSSGMNPIEISNDEQIKNQVIPGDKSISEEVQINKGVPAAERIGITRKLGKIKYIAIPLAILIVAGVIAVNKIPLSTGTIQSEYLTDQPPSSVKNIHCYRINNSAEEDMIKIYTYGWYFEDDFNMISGGKKYTKGVLFSVNAAKVAEVCYKLNGKHKHLNGLVGFDECYMRVDKHYIAKFYLDNVLKKELDLKKGEQPTSIDFDIKNAKELKIEFVKPKDDASADPNIDLLDMVLE